jgi:hypothetical protein
MGVNLMAAPNVSFFSNYLNPVFVETGSNLGQGVMMALAVGFDEIYSIELSQQLHEICLERFKDNDNVHLIQGNSSMELGKVISGISVPITFWIDAHYSGGITAGEDGHLPILDELMAIKNHSINNHTILIDDMRDWDINIITKAVIDINPNYEISLVDGYGYEKDILVARVKA